MQRRALPSTPLLRLFLLLAIAAPLASLGAIPPASVLFDASVSADSLTAGSGAFGSPVTGWDGGPFTVTGSSSAVVSHGPGAGATRAVYFGNSASLSVGGVSGGTLSAARDGTITAVIKASSDAAAVGFGSLFGWGSPSNRKLLHLHVENTASNVVMQHGDPAARSENSPYTSSAIEAGKISTWVILTVRVADNLCTLYVDGELRQNVTFTTDMQTSLVETFYLGGDRFGNLFDGHVAELAFYTEAFTDAQLLEAEQAIIARYPDANFQHPANAARLPPFAVRFDASPAAGTVATSGSAVTSWDGGAFVVSGSGATVAAGPGGGATRSVLFSNAGSFTAPAVFGTALSGARDGTVVAVVSVARGDVPTTEFSTLFGWVASGDNRKLLHLHASPTGNGHLAPQHGVPAAITTLTPYSGTPVPQDRVGVDEWVILTWRVEDNALNTRVDGRLVQNGTYTTDFAATSAADFYLGNDVFGNRYFGKLAELTLYSVALTDEEVVEAEAAALARYPDAAFDYEPQCAGAAAVATALDESLTGVDGADLNFSVVTDASLQSASVAFVSSARTVDAAQCGGSSVWAAAADGCATRHSFARDLATTLDACGFEGPTADAARGTYFYESTIEVTTVNATDSVFGDAQTRTDVTSFRVRVEFANATAVEASAGVFGPAIDFSQLTTQVVSTATREFTFTLATSVQWPYYLVENGAAGATGGAFEDAAVATTADSGGVCDGAGEGEDQACTQRFELKARTASDECSVSTTVRQNFTIACRAAFTGSCDLPDPSETFATFDVETANLCPEVVEVASITPALTTYSDSGRTSVSTNYILETTLFARVTADVEAGLRAERTTLTGLDIVSSCSTCTPLVQPFTDTSAALADYNFQYVSGGTDNSVTGEVQTDFSFTLNTNSLSFDNDATTGEAQITLTAYVTVEYDTPSAQGLKRSYRVQAVSGPGSVGTSATAQAGVSSQPAATPSTAGSTVLGVSTGTAALAAVGLAAVAAVLVGAAVAAKRRRQSPSKQPSSSSSSSLNLSSVAMTSAAPGTAGLSTDDLGTVQAAYDASAHV